MDQFVYRLTPVREEMLAEGLSKREKEIIAEHFEYLSALTEQGVVKLAGRTTNTDPSNFGIMVFEAANEEAAREIMFNDPAVRENILAARLFPFKIALMGKPPA